MSSPASPEPVDDRRHAAVADALDALSALSGGDVEGQRPGEMLRRLADAGRDYIPGADEVSMTMLERGAARTVAFTGALAATLDERQYQDGFGPCLDAARTGATILVDTEDAPPPYGEFSRQALRRGVRHSMSVGMPTRGQVAAAINVYSRSADTPFQQESQDIARAFAGFAGGTLLNAALYTMAVQEAEQLRAAMTSRASIEQAKGCIMRERHCSADEAFEYLRKLSLESHRTIRDLAENLIRESSRTRSDP